MGMYCYMPWTPQKNDNGDEDDKNDEDNENDDNDENDEDDDNGEDWLLSRIAL